MTTLFPSVILQQQVNSVSTRHIQPNGHGSFDFVWTHFGFEDDSPEMTNAACARPTCSARPDLCRPTTAR
jgi:phenylpropionate dioxygenase-like ring-hydroxylating dioxygenase large terminal subunit